MATMTERPRVTRFLHFFTEVPKDSRFDPDRHGIEAYAQLVFDGILPRHANPNNVIATARELFPVDPDFPDFAPVFIMRSVRRSSESVVAHSAPAPGVELRKNT